MNVPESYTTCARHPNVQTGLRCASCGTYICPDCLVQTPVGAKCKDCASQRNSTLFSLSPINVIAAIAVGLIAGSIAGWAVEFSIGYFTLLLAFIFGGFAGEMIMRAAGRKRGVKMEIIAGVTMALGAIGGRMFVAMLQLAVPGQAAPAYGIFSVIVDLVIPWPVPIIALVIAIGSAVSRIRYI